MSHEGEVYDERREDGGVRRHLDVIKRVTGHAPPACPWRVMYDPLVREVLALMPMVDSGNLAAVVGQDAPAKVLEAIGVYQRALASTRSEDERLRHERAKATRR